MDDFLSKIKFIRSQKNLSQVDFAKWLGISRAYLADIESGRTKPSRNFLEALRAKGFSIDWLLQENPILEVIENNKKAENPFIIFIFGFTQEAIDQSDKLLKDLLAGRELIFVDAAGLLESQLLKKILNDHSKTLSINTLFNKLQDKLLNEDIILIIKNISLSKISNSGKLIRSIFKIIDDSLVRQMRKKEQPRNPKSSLIILDFPGFLEKNINNFGHYAIPIQFVNTRAYLWDAQHMSPFAEAKIFTPHKENF